MKRFVIVIYVLLGATLLLTLLFYFCHFHESFSSQQKDWSDFGNYFNGLLTPLLAIINIVVLVELTLAVSKIDKARTQAEIKAQKELLLVQIRRQSIESFCQVMNNYFDNKYIKEDYGKVSAFAADYLKKFVDTDFNFFDFGESKGVKYEILSLMNDINILHNGVQIGNMDRTERYLSAFDKKEKIINLLQANILESMNMLDTNEPCSIK